MVEDAFQSKSFKPVLICTNRFFHHAPEFREPNCKSIFFPSSYYSDRSSRIKTIRNLFHHLDFEPRVLKVAPANFTVSSRNSDPLPTLQTPPFSDRRSGRRSSGKAFSVCVSAKRRVHFSDSNTCRVASARSEGTPHPRMPPTAGKTMVAPSFRVEQTADPIPNAWHKVMATQTTSSSTIAISQAASVPSSRASWFVNGFVLL
mmetsp:Transcript_65353/g.132942  ORF Transcript_65353/g.132942 Transcript_65353/m.132942 type:complete len:203 (-) Transcript_65353:780-1388(-)